MCVCVYVLWCGAVIRNDVERLREIIYFFFHLIICMNSYRFKIAKLHALCVP